MEVAGAKTNVCVIVVTYNGIKWIERCLLSLGSGSVPVHTIVIDNLSSDGTVPFIRSNFPEVELIEAGENLGFGKANNIGICKALERHADYIFLLNQDAYLQQDCLENLLREASVDINFGILSPFHLSYDGASIERYFNDFIVAGEAPGFISDFYCNKVKPCYPVSFVHAAGWLLPVNTVKQVGGFDPLFHHYGEDNDYIQRVLFNKLKVGFVPSAIMFHLGTNATLIDKKKAFVLKRNFTTIHLKNPKSKFAGALLVSVKGIFDGITSGILFRDFSRIKQEFRLLRYVAGASGKIIASRKMQLKNGSYL